MKLLKAPTLNEKGIPVRNELGSPQGSILSPLVSNLYLHYVIDMWFCWINEKSYRGTVRIVRYADDAVFTFESLVDAETFLKSLTERLNKFGISLNEEKTKIVACGQRTAASYALKGSEMPTFTFLGFLHVWGISIRKKDSKRFWRVKRRTCPKRFRKKIGELKSHIQNHRHDKNLLPRMKSVTEGYINYFAINDNEKRVNQFIHEVKKLLFKYLNRRSQKRSFDWVRFSKVLEKVRFPENPRMRNLFFSSRIQPESVRC